MTTKCANYNYWDSLWWKMQFSQTCICHLGISGSLLVSSDIYQPFLLFASLLSWLSVIPYTCSLFVLFPPLFTLPLLISSCAHVYHCSVSMFIYWQEQCNKHKICMAILIISWSSSALNSSWFAFPDSYVKAILLRWEMLSSHFVPASTAHAIWNHSAQWFRAAVPPHSSCCFTGQII